MALITKTTSETIHRLGSACIEDLTHLFLPEDKTKQGLNLLTIALNETQSVEFLTKMLDSGYKIQRSHLTRFSAHIVAQELVLQKKQDRLSEFCEEKGTPIQHALRWPLSPAKKHLLTQLLLPNTPLDASSVRDLITSNVESLGYTKYMFAKRDDVSLYFTQTQEILHLISSHPYTHPSSFDWLSSDECLRLSERMSQSVKHIEQNDLHSSLLKSLHPSGKFRTFHPPFPPSFKDPHALLAQWISLTQSNVLNVATHDLKSSSEPTSIRL